MFDTGRNWNDDQGEKQCASSKECVSSLGPVPKPPTPKPPTPKPPTPTPPAPKPPAPQPPAPVPSGACSGVEGGEPFGTDQEAFYSICEPGRTTPTKMACAEGTLWDTSIGVCNWPK